jgi:hypothetical protein
METWDKAQKDGVNVPKIGFLLPFGANENTNTSLRHLYEKYYSKGLYQESVVLLGRQALHHGLSRCFDRQ